MQSVQGIVPQGSISTRAVAVTALAGAEAVLRLGSALLLGKLAATAAGAQGVATFGQFYALWSVVLIAGSGAFSAGVIRAVAVAGQMGLENDGRAVRACIEFSATTGLAVAACMLIGAAPISWLAFGAVSDWPLVASIGVLGGPAILMATVASIRNGQQRYVDSLLVRTAATIVSMSLAIGGAFAIGLRSALLGYAAGCLVAWLIWWCVSPSLRAEAVRIRAAASDRSVVRTLGIYGLMGVTSAIVLPVVLLVSRSLLASQSGWEAVGNWEAAFRVGDLVASLGTAVLSVYFLPRLMIASQSETVRLTRAMLAIAATGALVAMPMTLLFGREMLTALFSRELAPAAPLLGWQVAGSTLKLFGWCFAVQMQATAAVKQYVLSEVCFGIGFIALASLTTRWGAVGLTIAYVLSYLAYAAFFAWRYRSSLVDATERD